jgi:hypothetical protein
VTTERARLALHYKRLWEESQAENERLRAELRALRPRDPFAHLLRDLRAWMHCAVSRVPRVVPDPHGGEIEARVCPVCGDVQYPLVIG